jgi:hypothetical protein
MCCYTHNRSGEAMNAFVAAYLAMSYIPNASGAQLLPGYHHSPVPISTASAASACKTAWGQRYPAGEQLQLGGLALKCNYVATWQDGRFQGNSTRWTVSSL